MSQHFLNLGEKVLSRDIDVRSRKKYFILSHILKSADYPKNLEGYKSVVLCHFYSAVSRCERDKSKFMYFVNSFRSHCTILKRLNEDIDRAVRGVCEIRPEWRQNA